MEETNRKFKVAVLGVGGVGGYFGGKLAAYHQNSNDVDIIFIARGANANAIKENGLKLITGEGETIVHPALVSDNASEIGQVDLLICCTKSYSLEESLQKYKSCIHYDTIILPLLNGVDSRERIIQIIPNANVLEGCVYVVSRLTKPGVITKTGNINALYFGSTHSERSQLETIEKILKVDGINAQLDDNIEQTVWEKFFFISTMATITSYANKTIGAVLADEENKQVVIKLLNELKQVTDTKGIRLPDNIVDLTFSKMQSFPYEATSSMHSDFQNGNKTELDSLTGYVVMLSQQVNVPTPVYKSVYEELKKKSR